MANNPFEVDYTKEKYTITILATENGHKFSIIGNGDYQPSYQEAIGSLEIMKIHFITMQQEANKQAAEKRRKEQEAQVCDATTDAT